MYKKRREKTILDTNCKTDFFVVYINIFDEDTLNLEIIVAKVCTERDCILQLKWTTYVTDTAISCVIAVYLS